ncbi:MAG TPA: hypothetical protein VLQ89_00305 [Candidatus Binatia bacterium]|nr:hypothetical protein [Candidatus Binatia bacterium]
MEAKRLSEIEDIYQDLKVKFDSGKISGDEMKSELKKLMIRDEDNRFWMIGSKTGGWYVYDGSTWKPGNPYADEQAPPVTRTDALKAEHHELKAERGEQEPEEAPVQVFCKFCQSRLEKHDLYCNFCGGQQKGATKPSTPRLPEGQLLIRSVSIPALMFFCGGFGLIAGVVLGATFGIIRIFGDLIFQFPMMLQEMQGKIQGGLFFGALGGISGFLAFAALAFVLGLLFNLIAYVFGGLRFKVKS